MILAFTLAVCLVHAVVNDFCSPDPCDHGSCANSMYGYTCNCHTGYKGETCDQVDDHCSPDPCDHGSCANSMYGYTCTCHTGYKGETCDQITDNCSPDPCDHGSCANSMHGYRCVCDTGYRGDTCDHGPPHIILPGVFVVTKGDDVLLECDVIAFPDANVTWAYTSNIANAYIAANGSLVILDAQPKDASYFTCVAMNKYGKAASNLTLIIEVPPEVVVTPEEIAVEPDVTSIALECKAEGDAPLDVTWYKDGQEVTAKDDVYLLPGNVLLVSQAKAADVGEYTCVAVNNIGNASSTAYAYLDMKIIGCSDDFNICTESLCGGTCPSGCSNGLSRSGTTTTTQTVQRDVCEEAIYIGVITNTSGGLVMWTNEFNIAAILVP